MYTPFKVGDTRIETKRLLLRGWEDTRQDAEDMFAYAQLEIVGRPAGWKYHASVEESRKILRMFVEEDDCFAVVSKETGRIIGSLGLHEPKVMDADDPRRGLEVGYVLNPDYWGKGMMTEAVRAVIDWVFHNTDAEVLFCGHFTFNDRSRRVIEKCGFTYLKNCVCVSEQLGETFDERMYILTKNA